MKKIFASIAAVALFAGASAAQQKPVPAKPATATTAPAAPVASTEIDLTAQLPASDFAATMNLKRILNEMLPQVLASQPAELAKINQGIADFKAKTGVDLRQFEQAALSVSYKSGANGASLEPVMLVRGAFNPVAMIGAAKLAANGKFRQETIAGKNVVLITIPDEAAKDAARTAAAASKDKFGQMIDNLFKGEVAVVALDARTLAFGKPVQVRSLLAPAAPTARLDKDFAAYLNRKSAAVTSFAFKIPAGLTDALGLSNTGNDQITNIVNSLRQLYGSVDTNGGDASVSLAARTAVDQQAQELEELLQMGKSFGGGILAGKNDPQNQAFARIVQNTQITRSASEVQIDTVVPNEVFNLFFGGKQTEPAVSTDK